MKNKLYSIVSVLIISIFSLPIFLYAQLIESKPEETYKSYQKADTSNAKSRKEKILNPSLNHFLSGFKRVFTRKDNLIYLATGTAVSLIVWPYDDEISNDLKDDNVNEFELEAPAKLGNLYVVFGTSSFIYLFVRAIKKPYLANTGLYVFEAFLTTQLITHAIKNTVHRTRPSGQNNLSFPSGHTSGMFTVASVLDKRYGNKVGIPSYLIAGFVGISRIKLQKHFPTDVIAGAALGIIIGRSFVPSNNKNKTFAVLPAYNLGYAGVNFRMNF